MIEIRQAALAALKSARISSSLTRRMLATMIGCSAGHVNHLEGGRVAFSRELLDKYVRATGAKLSDEAIAALLHEIYVRIPYEAHADLCAIAKALEAKHADVLITLLRAGRKEIEAAPD